MNWRAGLVMATLAIILAAVVYGQLDQSAEAGVVSNGASAGMSSALEVNGDPTVGATVGVVSVIMPSIDLDGNGSIFVEIPQGMSIVDASPAGYSTTGNTASWDFSSIQRGITETRIVTATVDGLVHGKALTGVLMESADPLLDDSVVIGSEISIYSDGSITEVRETDISFIPASNYLTPDQLHLELTWSELPEPDDTVTATLSITNTGWLPRSFAGAFVLPPGWTYAAGIQTWQDSLAAGATGKYSVSVTANDADGAWDFEAQVYAIPAPAGPLAVYADSTNSLASQGSSPIIASSPSCPHRLVYLGLFKDGVVYGDGERFVICPHICNGSGGGLLAVTSGEEEDPFCVSQSTLQQDETACRAGDNVWLSGEITTILAEEASDLRLEVAAVYGVDSPAPPPPASHWGMFESWHTIRLSEEGAYGICLPRTATAQNYELFEVFERTYATDALGEDRDQDWATKVYRFTGYGGVEEQWHDNNLHWMEDSPRKRAIPPRPLDRYEWSWTGESTQDPRRDGRTTFVAQLFAYWARLYMDAPDAGGGGARAMRHSGRQHQNWQAIVRMYNPNTDPAWGSPDIQLPQWTLSGRLTHAAYIAFHEYGHLALVWASGSQPCCGNQNWDAPGALSEGWSTAFGLTVLEHHGKFELDGGVYTSNIEELCLSASNRRPGPYGYGSAAAVLWDLWDGVSLESVGEPDLLDLVTHTAWTEVWDVLENDAPNHMCDFRAAWVSGGHQQETAVLAVFDHYGMTSASCALPEATATPDPTSVPTPDTNANPGCP